MDFLKIVYLHLLITKSNFIYIDRDKKKDKAENEHFLDYWYIRYGGRGLVVVDCDGTRAAPSEFLFVERYLQLALSRRPKLWYGSKKLMNSILFAALCNNTFNPL